MNQIKLSILTLFSFVLLFSACAGGGGVASSNDTLSSIPADVSMVTKINVKSIMDKMDFKSVRIDNKINANATPEKVSAPANEGVGAGPRLG